MTRLVSNLQINSARLWQTIQETARFGATRKGGVSRVALGLEDKQVRDWFCAACLAAGCDVRIDALGSIFAVRPGRDMSKPPVGTGSHLDTQPTGGKFDGILGVCAALEIIRTLNDADIQTEAPICIVNWTNEEGARFAPAMMASGVYAGAMVMETILAQTDADGITVADALDAIGYRGPDAVGALKLGSFVELHIEQGPILEAESKAIGIVEAAQGVSWYDGRITGFQSHAGSTPMGVRRDALLALSEIALTVEQIAIDLGDAVGTVGEVVIDNPSRNVIPGDISFTVDCRSADSETARRMDETLRAEIAVIATRRKVTIEFRNVLSKAPTQFDADLTATAESVAIALGYCSRRITSGAGHDSCHLATCMPTTMVFVPCKDGVSHNEAEDATQSDCAAGANVLLHTVLALAGILAVDAQGDHEQLKTTKPITDRSKQ